MSKTLTEHAAYELKRAGLVDNEDAEARKVAYDTMALVKRFVKQEHNQITARYVLQFFNDLCNFLPISSITDNPDEWEKFEVDTKNTETGETYKLYKWQSKRAPSFFSVDEGRTWTDERSGQTGVSLDHKKVDAEQAEQAKEAKNHELKLEDKIELKDEKNHFKPKLNNK